MVKFIQNYLSASTIEIQGRYCESGISYCIYYFLFNEKKNIFIFVSMYDSMQHLKALLIEVNSTEISASNYLTKATVFMLVFKV